MFENAYSRLLNSSPENRRLLLQDGFLLEVAESLSEAMENAGLSRSDLAEALNTSKGYVTQVLAGDKNITLKTLWSVADAIGCDINLRLDSRDGHVHRIEFNGTSFETEELPNVEASPNFTLKGGSPQVGDPKHLDGSDGGLAA